MDVSLMTAISLCDISAHLRGTKSATIWPEKLMQMTYWFIKLYTGISYKGIRVL